VENVEKVEFILAHILKALWHPFDAAISKRLEKNSRALLLIKKKPIPIM
jgi:hypothetical protein